LEIFVSRVEFNTKDTDGTEDQKARRCFFKRGNAPDLLILCEISAPGLSKDTKVRIIGLAFVPFVSFVSFVSPDVGIS
jgi:hypothetical protein